MKNKAFTIVETLVAIMILMVAISGPLTSAFRGLNAASAARDQMIATQLAQEGVEAFRNLVDSNIRSGRAATQGFLLNVNACYPNKRCRVNTFPNISVASQDLDYTLNPVFRLYKNPGNNYFVHTSGANATPFYRSAYLQSIRSDSADLIVEVAWKSGPYSVENITTAKLTLYNVER